MASPIVSAPPVSRPDKAWARWRGDRFFWAVLALSALLGLAYNAAILPGFGPDEARHFGYVRLLLEEHRLPMMLPDGSELGGAHTYHPPAYYVFLLPFFALGKLLPGQGIYHLLRLASLLLCLAALPLIYDITYRAGSLGGQDDESRTRIARFCVAFVGLLPIWGMTGGIINNDSALLFSVALFVWLLTVRFLDDASWKSALVMGLVFALGALSKATAVLCDGMALVLVCWLQSRADRRALGRIWARAGVTLALGVALAAPWYARNAALYGTYQPVPKGYTNPALPAPSNGMLVMAMHPNFPALLGQANWGIFYTLWAQRDWIMQVKSPYQIAPLNATQNALYYALLGAVLFAAIGHRKRSRAPKPQAPSPETPVEDTLADKCALRAAYGAFGVAWLACLQIALFVHWGQAEGGRYLLPGAFGLSLFLARGFDGWFGRRLGTATLAWGAFWLGVNALCIYWLLAYLNPTYGPR